MGEKRMTTRQYDAALLQALTDGARTERYKGVEVVVKPIPEGGQDGDMDPRVYKSMKSAARMMGLMKLLPKSKRKKTPLQTVLPLRKMFNSYKGAYIADEGVKGEHVTVNSADGYKVPVRIYTRETRGENLPVFVYYHGGGFFGGGPDIVEQMCKLLVQMQPCVVFNVDYRLCPENSYPAPLDDCFYATKWAHENAARYGGNPARMAVAGDSAGGNLAAAVTLRDRDEKTDMVKATVLLYPAINLSGAHTEFFTGVHREQYRKSERHKKVLEATLGLMDQMAGGDKGEAGAASAGMLDELYLQGKLDAKHPYASPLLADAGGLPPVLLVFGEHDFLAFEDFAYAQTLTKAGVALSTVIYRGMGHGFADQIGVSPQAEDCMREISAFLGRVL